MIKIVAVGDVMLGELPISYGFGVKSSIENKPEDSIFGDVKPILNNADICFGNLECVLSDFGYRTNDIIAGQMRGKPEYAGLLHDAGFNVMSVANNHIMQHGSEAFNDTQLLLKNKRIKPVGISDGNNECIPQFFKVKDLKVCFLAYCLKSEKYCKPILYANNKVSDIINEVDYHKKQCDLIIVSLHWGDEFIDIPSQDQIKDAHKIIDAGASIIIGHHPHILQGIEKYKHGVIAYSLGNFIFDFFQKRFRESMIIEFYLFDHKIDFNIIPIFLDKNHKPRILSDKNANCLKNKIKKISKKVKLNNPIKKRSYNLKVKKLELKVKIENRLYFIKNLYKYPGNIAIQSLINFIKIRKKKPLK